MLPHEIKSWWASGEDDEDLPPTTRILAEQQPENAKAVTNMALPVKTSYTSYPTTAYKQPVYIQHTDKVREVVRGDGTMDDLLFDLIRHASPHGHEDDVRQVIRTYLKQFNTPNYVDKCGNLIAQVGKIWDGSSGTRTMFSCHMDTVHRRPFTVAPMVTVGQGPDSGYVYGASKISNQIEFLNSLNPNHPIKAGELPALYKALGVEAKNPALTNVGKTDAGNPVFRVSHDVEGGVRETLTSPTLTKFEYGPKYTAEVLGADDKLGCYILCQLIAAGVPGFYVFHVGEEVGGIGSSWLVKNTPHLVEHMDRCVAFDRRGYEDVITHQAGGRCASNDFGKALADALNVSMPPMNTFKPSDEGIFTDSANYTDLISECTNISVGYKNEHTCSENFDLHFLTMILIPALKAVSWESLPVVRDPTVQDYSGYYSRYDNAPWEDDWEAYKAKVQENSKATAKQTTDKKELTKYDAGLGKADKPKSPVRKRAERIVRNLSKVPPSSVTKNTPKDSIPEWTPEDGLVYGCSKESMVLMIALWASTTNKTYRELAELVYEQMLEQAALERELEEYELEQLYDK